MSASVGAIPGSLVIHQGTVPVAFMDHPELVSVMEFGAVGDGATDDVTNFQNGINALAGSGLGLMVPASNFYLNSAALTNTAGVPIVVCPGAQFTGAHAASINYGGATMPFVARAVVTTLQAYGGTGTGTLTESSNGAISAADGVTLAVGDVVLIQAGTTNLTAAKDSGPWVVTNLGGASAKWVLQRPGWWLNGSYVPWSTPIVVGGEGTLWASTQWKATVAFGKVVGTDDPAIYVKEVTQQVTFVASAATISNVGVLSATKSQVLCSYTGTGAIAATVGYGTIAALTAGYIGTGSIPLVAIASGMGKNGTTDVGVVNVTVRNW